MNRTLSLCCGLLLLAAAPAVAQPLNGIYTVDATLPTGGTNYATLQAAANALTSQGVNGPVIIAVAPSPVPYAGFSLASPIPGSSAVNTVSLVAVGPVIVSGPAAGFTQAVRLGTASVTTLGGPAHVTIDGFEITGSPSGAGLIATGCSFITVRNCTVHTCGAGIYFGATSDSVIEDCIVFGVGNECGAPGSNAYSGGITSYYNSHNVTIQRNDVRNCTGVGIFVGTSGSTTAPNNNVVINNFVSGTPGTGTYPGGIAIRRTGQSIIANNSIWMPAGSSNGGIHLMGGSTADPQPAQISNNIVRHDGSGGCFRFESATVVVPPVFDYNLYDPQGSAVIGQVATTPYATLAAWQGLTAPNLAGRETNTLAAPAGFVGPNDLHITPASPAFNTGSTVAAVTVDIDGQSRPMNGIPDRGADETPGTGLFPSFTATPLSGPVPLMVNFTDTTFTSDPGGVLTWSWDFDNDGISDSTLQNPSYIYPCPGVYSVALTVTDASHPSATMVRTNYINVGEFIFSVSSTGGGVADMNLIPVPTTCGKAQGAIKGYTLVSGAVAGNLGSGPFFGIGFDAITLQFIQTPPWVGNVIHFIPTPTSYPNTGSIFYPAGFFAPLVGQTLDCVMVFQGPGGSLLHWSNASRVSF